MKPDFYKLLVEETPDALIATSRDGKVLHWNRGAETTFGYASAEAVGRTLNELIIPPDRLEEEKAANARRSTRAPPRLSRFGDERTARSFTSTFRRGSFAIRRDRSNASS